MGLDSFVAVKNESGKFETELPIEIQLLFRDINTTKTVVYSGCGSVSFMGKYYNQFVKMVTNDTFSLFQNLEADDLLFIYSKIDAYLNEYDVILKTLNELAKANWDNQELLDKWFDNCFNMYHPQYDEICSLREVFKICAENNLCLYASY